MSGNKLVSSSVYSKARGRLGTARALNDRKQLHCFSSGQDRATKIVLVNRGSMGDGTPLAALVARNKIVLMNVVSSDP